MTKHWVLLAWGSACALAGATGCAVDGTTPEADRSQAADQAASTVDNRSRQAQLLHEIRLSPTRTTQFWELAPGELVMVREGRLDTDPQPSEAEPVRSALETFSSLSTDPPPERLVQAQARADEIDAQWAKRTNSPNVLSAPTGLRPNAQVQIAANAGRQFLGAAWWEQAACAESGFTDYYVLNGERFNPFLACWSNLMRYANSGDLGITMQYEARFAGVTTAASYKHFFITCTNYVLFTNCNWDLENYSVNLGFWKTVTAFQRKTRAGELHTPNDAGGGYFSLKFYDTSLALSGPFCRNDVFDCSHWPFGI